MSIKFYEAWSDRIGIVWADSETEHFIVRKSPMGRTIKDKKIASSRCYFKTFSEAKTWLIDQQTTGIAVLGGRLNYAKEKLAKIEAITEPEQEGDV